MSSELQYQLRFDGSLDAACHWAARSGVEHALDLDHLEELYDNALPYLTAYCSALESFGWVAEDVQQIGGTKLAACLGRDDSFIVDSDDSSAPHVARLVLPRHFSAFIDSEFAQDWAAMFSNLVLSYSPSSTLDIFPLGRAGLPRPLQNIVYLLQTLSPGILVVRSTDDEDCTRVSDAGLPPAIWVGEHINELADIFGSNLAVSIYNAADDTYCAVEYLGDEEGSTTDTVSDTTFDEEDWSSWNHSAEELVAQMDESELEIRGETKGNSNNKVTTTFNAIIPDPIIEQQDLYEAVYPEGGSASYRHCDSSCKFCGRCSDRFAERLTELLLRTAIAV